MSYSTLEYVLEDRRHLHDVELGAVEMLAGRLGQPGLEQLDRGRDAEKQGKWEPIAP